MHLNRNLSFIKRGYAAFDYAEFILVGGLHMTTNRIRRILLLVIVFTLFVQCGFMSGAENSSSNDIYPSTVSGKTVSDSGAELEKEQPVGEVESLRTANSKHYKLSDGTYEAYAFLSDVHRKDSSGNWKEIDNNLSLSKDSYTTKDGYISFAKEYGKGDVYTIVSGEYRISTGSINDAKASKATVANPKAFDDYGKADCEIEKLLSKANSETRVLYKDVLKGIDVEYILSNNNVKENIIINSYEGISSFRSSIEAEGLELVQKDNVIYYLDRKTKEPVFEMPELFMYDSSGEVSYKVGCELSATEKGYYLTVSADEEWLKDPDRAYPVVIDPAVYARTINQDSYVSRNNPTTNYGNASYLRVQDDSNNQCFGLIKMAMPELSANATISSAFLYVSFYSTYTYSTSMDVSLYMINNSWSETGVTWNSASSASFMDSTACETGTLACSTQGYYKSRYINATNVVKQLYANRTNRGIAIKYSGGTCKSLPIESKESSDSSMRPYYRILYYTENLPLANGTYFIKNAQLNGYMQIDNDTASNGYNTNNAILELFAFDGESYQQWNIEYLHNGYYSIKSVRSSKAVTVKPGKEHTVDCNLVQSDYTASDRQQWSISATSGGRYVIKAASSYGASNNLVMSLGSGSGVDGRDVLQGKYVNNSSYLDEWLLYAKPSDSIFLDVLYDNAYTQRYSGYSSRINNLLNKLREKYLSEFGIWINLNGINLFNSYPDSNCSAHYSMPCLHGYCENSEFTLTGEVVLKSYHHSNITNILARINPPNSSHTAKLAFTGHRTCVAVGGKCKPDDVFGITAMARKVILMSDNRSAQAEILTAVHEFGHLLGAPDHYRAGVMSTEGINSEHPGYGFSRTCIYGEDKDTQSVINNLTICDGCRRMIEENSGSFN